MGVDLMSFVAVESLNKSYVLGAKRIHVLRDLDLERADVDTRFDGHGHRVLLSNAGGE